MRPPDQHSPQEARIRLRRKIQSGISRTNHAVPYGTGLLGQVFQALRAWLRSLSPYGTAFQPCKMSKLQGSSSPRRPVDMPDAAARPQGQLEELPRPRPTCLAQTLTKIHPSRCEQGLAYRCFCGRTKYSALASFSAFGRFVDRHVVAATF